ncbi:hypothetical protein MLD38_009913 [Melastoma candidum]|uniref:Uncharacterized protein n=1 Tax=Melastoma candidum TaxID=119954 RepID=A0ACB9R1P3_9MYRT|nr:hypothetical protein MLD38_009913 [Melastoma candidum]
MEHQRRWGRGAGYSVAPETSGLEEGKLAVSCLLLGQSLGSGKGFDLQLWVLEGVGKTLLLTAGGRWRGGSSLLLEIRRRQAGDQRSGGHGGDSLGLVSRAPRKQGARLFRTRMSRCRWRVLRERGACRFAGRIWEGVVVVSCELHCQNQDRVAAAVADKSIQVEATGGGILSRLGLVGFVKGESFGRGLLNGVRWLAAFLTVIWSFIHPSLVIIPYRDTAVTKSASFGFGVRIFATALCSTISISFRSRPDVPELMRRSGTMTTRFFFSTLVFIRCSASPQHSLRGCD